MDIENLVDDYIEKFRYEAKRELGWFKKQKTIEDAIKVAALAERPSGKRFAHQRRLKKEVLEKAKEILLQNKDKIKKTKNFDELYNLISKLLKNIFGIGPLYIYDTSLRIGAYLGFEPKDVYLHAGTLEGARALGFKGNKISVKDLPKSLGRLKPREIEDFLCIYKDELKKLSKTKT